MLHVAPCVIFYIPLAQYAWRNRMRTVQYIVFRYLTDADYFHIYKPTGTEAGGGGQSYIDFKTGAITPEEWQAFFSGTPSEMRVDGPRWTFPVWSIGINDSQNLTIFQRRPQSFAISSQKITSSQSHRVYSWLPENGFPEPDDPTDRQACPDNLVIYIVRTTNDEYWAGWFQNTNPSRDSAAARVIADMLPPAPVEGHAGFINANGALLLDETDSTTPFYTSQGQTVTSIPTAPLEPPTSPGTPPSRPPTPRTRPARSEEEIMEELFNDDESPDVPETAEITERIVRTRTRNARAISDLKRLYQGKCQITSDSFSFKKKNGDLYCEAHHLVALGEEGADSPFNIIIVNPLIHRMLHYANVSKIDLSRISEEDTLDIEINEELYTISWHPRHAEYVRRHQDIDDESTT